MFSVIYMYSYEQNIDLNVFIFLSLFYCQGKPTESTVDIKVRKYGEVDAEDFVKGAEVLSEANDGDVTEKGGEKNGEEM